jgi:hypothetical protein
MRKIAEKKDMQRLRCQTVGPAEIWLPSHMSRNVAQLKRVWMMACSALIDDFVPARGSNPKLPGSEMGLLEGGCFGRFLQVRHVRAVDENCGWFI